MTRPIASLTLAIVVIFSTASSGSPATGSTIARILGYSVEHRPIVATLITPPTRVYRSMLVVGSIAGDEPGGTAVVKLLASLPPVAGVRLWLIPTMNPDGAVDGTRVNADGVDLNRNFPYRWRNFVGSSRRYFPGSRPDSEPESRAVRAFIARVHPGLTVWLHQPYALVDDSQGPRRAERLLSWRTGLRLVSLPDYAGSAIGWEDHLIPGSAFDLELAGEPLSRSAVARYALALRSLARAYANRHA